MADLLGPMRNRPKPYVMAHRGNSELCPENTLVAFRQAIAEGADVIETDLHVSADGQFVCIHDDTLERTTNGRGAVKSYTAAELQTFSAAYGRDAFQEERVPLLVDLLQILPEGVGLALELKCDDFLDEAVCRRLESLLRETGTMNRTVSLSFSRERLRTVEKATTIPVGLITMLKLLPEAGWSMTGPFWPVMFMNPFYVALGHRRGQFVCPLDPTPEPRLWYYRLLGCDAVLTNNPGKTRRALGR